MRDGNPVAPTPPSGDSSDRIATTAFVTEAGGGGITQLTGAVTAGPGSGSQAASIPGAAFGRAVITGGAAGNLTAPGIATTSKLMWVLQFIGAGTAVTSIADLTSQFTITAANTINNTGGTNTTGSQLFAQWIQ